MCLLLSPPHNTKARMKNAVMGLALLLSGGFSKASRIELKELREMEPLRLGRTLQAREHQWGARLGSGLAGHNPRLTAWQTQVRKGTLYQGGQGLRDILRSFRNGTRT